MDDLSTYLMNRGVDLDPTKVEEDPILESEALTKEAGELWTSKEALITMVVQARVNTIAKRLLNKAVPQEVLVLRQAMVEVAAIIDDFRAYKGAADRQENPTNNEDNVSEDAPTDPPEGEEGSL